MDFKNLTTRAKLILSFSVIVLANMAFGSYVISALSEMYVRLVFANSWTDVIFRLSEMSRQVTTVRRYGLDYLLRLSPEKDLLRKREDLILSIENHLSKYEKEVLTTEYDMQEQKNRDLELIEDAKQRWDAYRILSDKVVALCEAEQFKEARILANGDSFAACNALESAIEALIKFNRDGTEYEKGFSAQVYASARRMTALALAVVSVFSVAVTIYLSRQVRRSINELLRVSKAVGEGNFDVSAAIFARDDFGVLSAQYNDTIAKIKDLVAETEKHRREAEDATAAKSRFLASMSHEIRTPMNAIIGMSDLMRTDNLDETQKSYFEDIKAMSRALLQIINDILDSSKIEAGKMDIIPTNFSLRKMVKSVCSIGQYLAETRNLRFSCEVGDGVPDALFGDEVRIRQILTNIVNNAVKYTPEGWVSVRVERGGREGTPGVLFVVSDSGMGIKKEELPNLFEAFERLDKVKNRTVVGTGLGLSITKKLVEMMEGTVTVESEYGKGSVFSVFLPLPEGNPDMADREETPPVMAEGANVLVADDNAVNISVARGYLMRHGIEPDIAADGAEALKMVQEKRYDLVFMDHMMPVMDGLESIARIRALGGGYADLPIVVLSANVISDAVKSFFDAGANDFLAKPIEGKNLNEMLARWLPPEKTRTGEISEEAAPGAEDGDFVRALSEIGLNAAQGFRYTGGREAYLQILRQTCAELPIAAAAVMSFLEAGDLRQYAIRVHAMKSVFAMIGAENVSKAAYKLEMAAKSGDGDTCRAETEALCGAALSFREKFLSTPFAEEKSAEKEKVGAEELRQSLEALKENCLFGKTGEIDALAETLKRASLNEEVDARLGEILRLLNFFDYETAAERADALLNALPALSEKSRGASDAES